MDTDAEALTGKQIHELHTSGGGQYSWRQLESETGLTRAQLRGRDKTYRKKAGIKPAEQSSAKFEQDGPNRARGEAFFEYSAGIDDLIEHLQVDTNVWEVERWGYSSAQSDWEGYAKVGTTKVIDYHNGVQTGYRTDEKLETIPLHGSKCRIWATFRRIKPIAIHPVIQPVAVPATTYKPPKPKRKGIVRELYVGDAQIGYRRDFKSGALVPFHDRRVLDLALQVAIAAKVDGVRFGGDMLDLTEWTDKFIREPAFYQTTQPALFEWHWHLRRFREALPDSEIEWIPGNHEDRLRSMLLTHLPMAYELSGVGFDVPPALSMQNLLQLDALGVEYSGKYEGYLKWLNDEFAICHSEVARAQPGATARAIIDGKRAKIVFFHIHRQELVSMTWETRGGKIIAFAYCPGCACHIDGRVPGSKPGDNWNQGFSIGEYDAKGRLASVQLIPVESGRAIWDGQLFASGDALSDLRRDLPDWNWGE